MEWILDSDRPIYAQLVEQIQMQIVSGRYAPGDKIPSVRELAATAAVNPNTMQKAFAELERGGLIITQRTSGRIVTEDQKLIQKIRRQLAGDHLKEFLKKMEALGYSREEIADFVKEYTTSEKGEEA
ncbi:MAG: GntR family transcriptional regulator [Lachnospiraceae bacterium]|nr:GntR family transcriptional regulator [Lachnospiraceae bacterium]